MPVVIAEVRGDVKVAEQLVIITATSEETSKWLNGWL